MKQIKFLLERFRLIKPPKDLIEEEIQSILRENFYIDILRKNIRFKPPVVFLSETNPASRSEILLNQEEILEKIRLKSGRTDVKRIQFASRFPYFNFPAGNKEKN
jgi:hypothetical protein